MHTTLESTLHNPIVNSDTNGLWEMKFTLTKLWFGFQNIIAKNKECIALLSYVKISEGK